MNSPLKAPRVLLSRRAFFTCGRRLLHPDWTEEANRSAFGRDFGPHGHEYALDVAYDGPISTDDGMIVNIADLKPVIQTAVDGLNNHFLNEQVDYFRAHRPTAENIARYLWQTLPHSTGPGELVRLRLKESRRVQVEVVPQSMKISRSYEFAAAHRLFAPQLSEQENFDRFDKCSNPAGHGHNYNLEVVVEGEPDSQTGYIIPPAVLDSIVNEDVYERFDHKHLNVDCPEFN
ncbi:6-pyruvoyl tetrahydropterin synthase, partial [bacterium]